jgi:hypothetical protein
MRLVLIKLIISLILLAGLLPLLPHHDFLNVANPYDVVTMNTMPTVFLADQSPGDQNRDHPIIDCDILTHSIVAIVLAFNSLTEYENIRFSNYSLTVSTRIVQPTVPPPNPRAV